MEKVDLSLGITQTTEYVGPHQIRTYFVRTGRIRSISDVLCDKDVQPFGQNARDRFRSKLEYYISEGYSKIFEPAYVGAHVVYRCHIIPDDPGGGFVAQTTIEGDLSEIVRGCALAKAIGAVRTPQALDRSYGRYPHADCFVDPSLHLHVCMYVGPTDSVGRPARARAIPRALSAEVMP